MDEPKGQEIPPLQIPSDPQGTFGEAFDQAEAQLLAGVARARESAPVVGGGVSALGRVRLVGAPFLDGFLPYLAPASYVAAQWQGELAHTAHGFLLETLEKQAGARGLATGVLGQERYLLYATRLLIETATAGRVGRFIDPRQDAGHFRALVALWHALNHALALAAAGNSPPPPPQPT